MSVRRSDVVIVDYPFSDRTGSKVRPALVVQADGHNQQLADTIIALITSSKRRVVGAATQLVIDITTPDGQLSAVHIGRSMREPGDDRSVSHPSQNWGLVGGAHAADRRLPPGNTRVVNRMV